MKASLRQTRNKSQHNIVVQAVSSFVDSESEPSAERYMFSYTITIHNQGKRAARLVTRHWLVSDAHGKIEEVNGEGVVGQQPLLQPGEIFRYTSGTMIATPVGVMQGSYGMISEDGETFAAVIPAFTLAVPRTLH
ncbi:MAG: Co2+/Mg2+ efflux protein ApaG [Methylococcaceae bacterium]|nr:MAG: Co2+/Mg2+ efflux protein ApaG [Methylococcaceae bacterium]